MTGAYMAPPVFPKVPAGNPQQDEPEARREDGGPDDPEESGAVDQPDGFAGDEPETGDPVA
jgi:hypothetical protein